MVGSFGAGRRIILGGTMIGGGRIKVSDSIRAGDADGSRLIRMHSGCDGGCDSTESE